MLGYFLEKFVTGSEEVVLLATPTIEEWRKSQRGTNNKAQAPFWPKQGPPCNEQAKGI